MISHYLNVASEHGYWTEAEDKRYRARMEKLANLVEYGRFDSSKLITHKFDKFDDIEEAMILMRDKPRDLIKPAVILDD